MPTLKLIPLQNYTTIFQNVKSQYLFHATSNIFDKNNKIFQFLFDIKKYMYNSNPNLKFVCKTIFNIFFFQKPYSPCFYFHLFLSSDSRSDDKHTESMLALIWHFCHSQPKRQHKHFAIRQNAKFWSNFNKYCTYILSK